MIRRFLTGAALALLAGCQGAPPPAYHEAAAHPFVIAERSVELALAGVAYPGLGARAAAFAADRPNDGSSFVVHAGGPAALSIVAALNGQGVAPRDIEVVAAEQVSITRVDRIARVAGCEGAPSPTLALSSLDDGFGHDNADSALLGCATRRNIAAMTADPRTLVAAAPFSGRSGARAADVVGKYAKGEPTQVPGDVSAASTSDLQGGGAAGGKP